MILNAGIFFAGLNASLSKIQSRLSNIAAVIKEKTLVILPGRSASLSNAIIE